MPPPQLTEIPSRLEPCPGRGTAWREIGRVAVSVITGLRERTARSLLADLLKLEILDSVSEKGAVFVRFPVEYRDVLFPRLFPDA